MVQFLITVHKMFKNGFFEACKIRLVFDMGRHHIPEAASQWYWERPSTLRLLFESGADKV